MLGVVLIVVGGLSKAIAKLIGALSDGPSPTVLDEALFPLLAPGMLLLAGVVAAVRSPGGWAGTITRRPVLVPLLVWSVAVVPGVALISWSRSLRLGRTAVLYGVNLVIAIGLAGMAPALAQDTVAQWVEQNVNLLGQAAFLIASVSLVTTVTNRSAGRAPDAGA